MKDFTKPYGEEDVSFWNNIKKLFRKEKHSPEIEGKLHEWSKNNKNRDKPIFHGENTITGDISNLPDDLKYIHWTENGIELTSKRP